MQIVSTKVEVLSKLGIKCGNKGQQLIYAVAQIVASTGPISTNLTITQRCEVDLCYPVPKFIQINEEI
jgi:hypothetical protein